MEGNSSHNYTIVDVFCQFLWLRITQKVTESHSFFLHFSAFSKKDVDKSTIMCYNPIVDKSTSGGCYGRTVFRLYAFNIQNTTANSPY